MQTIVTPHDLTWPLHLIGYVRFVEPTQNHITKGLGAIDRGLLSVHLLFMLLFARVIVHGFLCNYEQAYV